jgi:nitroreductase
MNQTIQTIFSRRSIRKYTGGHIPAEDLELIVKAGMSAPSAVNIRPWSFIVVTERDILDKLCASLPYAKMLDKAGAALIVCGIPDKDDTFAKDFWIQDCSAASENILLAAHSLGYGAVWTAVHPDPPRVSAVRSICGIPEKIIPLNVIPIGVPSEETSKPADRFDPEHIHWNRW